MQPSPLEEIPSTNFAEISSSVGDDLPAHVANVLAYNHRIVAQFPTASVPPDVAALFWLEADRARLVEILKTQPQSLR